MLFNENRKCRYCPDRARLFNLVVLGFQAEWGETKIDIPNVWAGTTSSKKLALLQRSLGILERTHRDGLLDIGHIIPIRGEMMREVPSENDYINGAIVAEEKALAYWEMIKGFEKTQVCRSYNNCYGKQVVMVNDVCGFVGIGGWKFSETLLKPGKDVSGMSQLIDYIMKPYQLLARKGGTQVVNRIEAAVAMLRPMEEKWREIKMVSGSSRAYIGFPIEPMLDRKFVERYVEYAVEQTDERAIMGAAGGLMHEYLVHQLRESGYSVSEAMPADDRMENEEELLLAHAMGFPPRLLWKIIQTMYGNTNGVSGKPIIMEPEVMQKGREFWQ